MALRQTILPMFSKKQSNLEPTESTENQKVCVDEAVEQNKENIGFKANYKGL